MSRRVRLYLVGSFVLLALAGCGGGWLMEQREPWRQEAEIACLKSGAVKESEAIAQLPAIKGPGVCGADFPLKVASLGESAVIGFADEMRPPGTIPTYAPITRRAPAAAAPQYGAPAPEPYPQTYPQSQPSYGAPYRSSEPYRPETEPPYQQAYPPTYGSSRAAPSAPMSLRPPGVGPEDDEPEEAYPQSQPSYGSRRGAVSRSPLPEPYNPRPYSVGDGPYVPPQTQPPDPYYTPSPRSGTRGYPAEPVQRAEPLPPLGPARGPAIAGGPAAVAPAATLACPMVSALDQWIAGSVQPASLQWFGQPVVEIRQISAYSCRGMNGNRHARISEHAFGNALDISAFTLADGRKITVKDGWRGLPEERGFLRDVHAAACQQFTTVLGPGSNVYHADHLHVDLMRRSSGRSICNPAAVPGDLVAGRRGDMVTGSVSKRRPGSSVLGFAPERESAPRGRSSLPTAVPGED